MNLDPTTLMPNTGLSNVTALSRVESHELVKLLKFGDTVQVLKDISVEDKW